MSIGDFINDPFGTAGKAMADLAPDSVRETVHEAKSTLNEAAQSVTNPTMPDSSALRENFSQGETTMPESHALGENTNPGDISVEIGPAQIEPDQPAGTDPYAGLGAEGSATPDPGPYAGLGAEGSATPDPGPYAGLGVAAENADPVRGFEVPDAEHFDLPQYVDEHGIAGPNLDNYTLGEDSAPAVRSDVGFLGFDKENLDNNGPMVQPAEPSLDSPPSDIIHPDPYADGGYQPTTVGEQAEGYGAGGEADSSAFDVF
jgi:hypothetical protein